MGVTLFIAFVLLLVAVLVLLITQSRTEVRPATALVYNNMWTGKIDVIFPGTGFVTPGVHRILEKEVSLKNEAENPSNVNLITGDGIELEVDYIVKRLQVGYPDMPHPEEKNKQVNKDEMRTCVIKAATAINYSKRRDLVLTRIVAKLQGVLETKTLNQLFPQANVKKGERGKVDKEVMKSIENDTNKELLKDPVTQDWGFWVEIDLEDYNLPAVIRKAREESSSAKIAGKALKEKARAAGIDPRWFVLGDALSNLFSNKNKKGGDKE